MNDMRITSKEQSIQEIKNWAKLTPTNLLKTVTLDKLLLRSNGLTYDDIISVFAKYMPLDRGNKKLSKGVFSFSLLPVVTCEQHCPGCYDVKSLRYKSVRLKRIVNTMLAVNPSHRERLFHDIFSQIKQATTCKYVRIHVGGDFFSAGYALKWCNLARGINIPVYTYTKTNHTHLLKKGGINVVKSRLDDGSFNFGTLEELLPKVKAVNGYICPATLRDVPDGFCGDSCRACMKKENVFFVKH